MEQPRIENRPLIDSFGRKHDYLRLSLTERCNLRCFYCMPKEGIPVKAKSNFMSDREVFQIAETFAELGVKKIRLTGGEPLVRKHAQEIIRDLSSLDVELAISTNGILVDRFIETFKKANNKLPRSKLTGYWALLNHFRIA